MTSHNQHRENKRIKLENLLELFEALKSVERDIFVQKIYDGMIADYQAQYKKMRGGNYPVRGKYVQRFTHL